MEKKYDLREADTADQKAFEEGLNKLLTELSLTISLVVNKKPIVVKLADGITETGFMDSPSILLQKKVEQTDAEIVSPIQSNDLDTPKN